MNMMMTMRVSAVTLVVVVACASLVVTSSAFAHNNHEGHGHGHGHEQQHTHASHSTTCDHDKLKNRPGYGRNAPRDHVRYQAHDDYPQHFPASRRDVRTAHVLTVDPNATLGNMRMRAYFDSAACPGPGCGHCVNVGDTVQTFDGSNTVVCAADDIATAAKQAYVMDVLIAGAARFLGDALRINPVSGNLPVSAGNCGSPGTPVPAAHSSGGVANADFAIYVTMAPKTDTTSLTVAWALSCRYDIAGRPTAAHVNFIPRRLNNAGPRDPVATQGDTLTAIHEISHALGFASPFFDGNGYYDLNLVNQPGGTVTVPSAAPFFKARTVINSPRVLREVREYFACPTAVGAEVEDQGGAGTAASHFEKRVFNQDAMAGISSTVAAFPSRVQLAFFEDTGHYVANYSAVASFYAT